ncbi:MAG TPA: hypothetical protein VHA82_19495 [Ramlibacter sp.]|uniref:hypothetical protein n=1 Tax=Ramlibacter sp. TaxID=1917967 RepID=UPI002C7F77B4|nr:hypothetical protein [Ramlibacter sp.]HVZ46002.1 hypothetical protein [Ramlibacter sp.]
MRMLCRLLALLAVSAAPWAASAQELTFTYSGLVWDFSTSAGGFANCTALHIDASGNPGHSVEYSVYGRLYCPLLGGYYASHGNAYFDELGRFNMKVDLGVANQLQCSGMSGFHGDCTIYNNNGSVLGTAHLTLQ